MAYQIIDLNGGEWKYPTDFRPSRFRVQAIKFFSFLKS